MTVSPVFKWIIGVITTLVLTLVIFDGFGAFDNYFSVAAIAQQKTSKAAQTDDFMEGLYQRIEGILPKFSDGSMDDVVTEFYKTKNAGRRTELAFDLLRISVSHKIRSEELTSEQEKAEKTATEYLQWVQKLVAYYLKVTPDQNIGSHQIDVKGFEQILGPQDIKKILTGVMAPSVAQCTQEKFDHLLESYPEEFLAMQLTDIVKLFLALQSQIQGQLFKVVKAPLVAEAKSENDRLVLETLFKISSKNTKQASEIDERMKEILKLFSSEDIKKLAFNIYLAAPDCFTPTSVGPMIKNIRMLQTKVRAKYFLDILQKYYQMSGKVPEDFSALPVPNPTTVREEFYSRAADGRGVLFKIVVIEGRIQLISAGEDYRMDTEDDFVAAEGPLKKLY